MVDRAINVAVLAVAILALVPVLPMPRAAKRFGYCVGVLFLLVAAGLFFWPEKKNESPAGPVVRSTGNGNCNVAGTGNQVNCAPSVSPPAPTPIAKAQPVPEQSVLLDCQYTMDGVVVPADQRIIVLELFGVNLKSGMDGAAYLITNSAPGSIWKLGISKLQQILKCSATSYESGPLFNVEMRLKIAVMPAIKRPDGGQQSNGISLEAEGNVPIPRLEPGSANSSSFYILNFDDAAFMQVGVPDKITALRLGDSKRHILNLIPPEQKEFTLSPMIQDTK